MKISDLGEVRMDALLKKQKKNNIKIDSETQFTENFIDWVLKTKNTDIEIINSTLLCRNDINFNNCRIENCFFQFAPFDVINSKLKNVKVYNCNFFSVDGSTLNDSTFIGGVKQIKISHPIVFEFSHGTIMNLQKDMIDFFGFIESYAYFLQNKDVYPYNQYAAEIESIILMGAK